MLYNGDVSMPALRRLADTLGLDSASIEPRMDDPAITEQLQATRALAQQLRITGTPTFVLEDEMLRGYLPYDQLEIIVADKRG